MMNEKWSIKGVNNWQKAETDIFWGEVAPCDHVLQIYENDSTFIDALSGFVGTGIKVNECVIVVATQSHLDALNDRLHSYGINIDVLIEDNRYVPLNAEETLNEFMRDGWPDDDLFNTTVTQLLARGQAKNRRVRVFGEMVALLWAQGLNGATVHLENLWSGFCEKQNFCLFCAYPKTGFTQDITTSLEHICHTHSKLINGIEPQMKQVIYSEIGNT